MKNIILLLALCLTFSFHAYCNESSRNFGPVDVLDVVSAIQSIDQNTKEKNFTEATKYYIDASKVYFYQDVDGNIQTFEYNSTNLLQSIKSAFEDENITLTSETLSLEFKSIEQGNKVVVTSEAVVTVDVHGRITVHKERSKSIFAIVDGKLAILESHIWR